MADAQVTILPNLTNSFSFVGKRQEASQLFTKMQEEGIKPGLVCTHVVYISQTYALMIKRDLNCALMVVR